MRILADYERASCQAVNLNKSAITFGAKVIDDIKTRLRRVLNIHNDGGCGKYLGLPEHIGRKEKKEVFKYIVEKVKNRTQGWFHRFLSEAGKEIFFKKMIALAMPVYTMNCFKLSKGICDEINSVLAEYWWSKGSGIRSMHSFMEKNGFTKKGSGTLKI